MRNIFLLIAGISITGCTNDPAKYDWDLAIRQNPTRSMAIKKKYGFYLTEKQVQHCIKTKNKKEISICAKKLKSEITLDTLRRAYMRERKENMQNKYLGNF